MNSASPKNSTPAVRVTRELRVRGRVQGVGFRPHVYRIAVAHSLNGWVRNDGHGVSIRVSGPEAAVDRFIEDLTRKAPVPARIEDIHVTDAPCAPAAGFHIVQSPTESDPSAAITPDLALCADCRREMMDPTDRRHHYPFINCTHCGPRYSIIERIPYDRPHTTMRAFTLCPDCRQEYEDPTNRRFHAQPNACPVCGPRIAYWGPDGTCEAERQSALDAAVAMIRAGNIVAVKGLGGFHLIVSASNEEAVQRLRQRKNREEKPWAVMFPSLDAIRAICAVSTEETKQLQSPVAPIVLLEKVGDLAPAVAPGNPLLGAMLPYTPLHLLLLDALKEPVVATSGNCADEPICIDEAEAVQRLGAIADGYLVHNRPIARPVDDSVVRIMAGRPMILRRARGYAPAPLPLPGPVTEPVLAMGAHLKNTVTLAVNDQAWTSQHLGDLDTERAEHAFEEAQHALTGLYRTAPCLIACDLHPDYASTRAARRAGAAPGKRVVAVQHHHAHVVACMVDNAVEGEVLGVAWDGTGYGPDNTVWGGEFLTATYGEYERIAHLRTFPLPGGDRAIREPARAALGLLYELYGEEAFTLTDLPPLRAFDKPTLALLQRMLSRGLNSPRTSSVGRLFDAVASLLDLRQQAAFEGQAAMLLEFAATNKGAPPTEEHGSQITLPPHPSSAAPLDWSPLIRTLINHVRANTDRALSAALFHESLAAAIVTVARHTGNPRVALSGGCFQNRLLLERSIELLRRADFQPYWHQAVPTNDGGISVGQALAAARIRP